MIENDYMMRIIHEMVRMWLKLLFNIDEVKEEEIIFEDLDSQQLYQKLRLMAEDGQINEAENLLYEHLQSQEQRRQLEDLKVSLFFYDYLNGKSSKFLHECGYSREEIQDGIRSVMRQHGYGELADTWGEEW